MTARDNRSIPSGTFVPALSYTQDVGTVVDWLVGAFGVTERFRAGDNHAQIAFGDGGCLISGMRTDLAVGNAAYMTIRVPDVDAIYARARAFGAEITSEPTEFMYGERQFGARDLGGHTWYFSQTVEDVDPTSWGGVLPE
ncbi:MAG: hypothetical protein M9953_14435 [Thermomicrobiales bacterium]|nr:hypothetical protein [Thermomicrobiales bacterium]